MMCPLKRVNSMVEISPGALLYGGGLSACLFDRMV
jgi:hypothetical protein